MISGGYLKILLNASITCPSKLETIGEGNSLELAQFCVTALRGLRSKPPSTSVPTLCVFLLVLRRVEVGSEQELKIHWRMQDSLLMGPTGF